jgi:hypothetical protein
MKKQFTIKFVAAYALFYWATAALSRSAHGLPGGHWHATDTLGFIVVAGPAAAAFWLSRK